MADRNGLGIIGVMLGMATFLVVLVGGVVVGETLIGHVPLENGISATTLPAATR